MRRQRWVRIETNSISKIKNGHISRGVANTLARKKKIFYPIGDGNSSNRRGRVLSETRTDHNTLLCTLEEVVFLKIYLKLQNIPNIFSRCSVARTTKHPLPVILTSCGRLKKKLTGLAMKKLAKHVLESFVKQSL